MHLPLTQLTSHEGISHRIPCQFPTQSHSPGVLQLPYTHPAGQMAIRNKPELQHKSIQSSKSTCCTRRTSPATVTCAHIGSSANAIEARRTNGCNTIKRDIYGFGLCNNTRAEQFEFVHPALHEHDPGIEHVPCWQLSEQMAFMVGVMKSPIWRSFLGTQTLGAISSCPSRKTTVTQHTSVVCITATLARNRAPSVRTTLTTDHCAI